MKIIGGKFIILKTDFLNGRGGTGWGWENNQAFILSFIVNCITV